MEPHFLDHPEVETYLRELLPALVAESDRGAVLLGASQIDEQLKEFFAALIPKSTSSRRRSEIFGFNGPFGSLSGKLDVAYACRLLPAPLIDAVHKFRKIRNDVAHKPLPFTLSDHANEVRQIFALLGPGVDVGVANLTVELMVRNVLARLVKLDDPVNEGRLLFESERAALDYLAENKRHLQTLEVDRLRWELGVGLGIVCGLILHHRTRLLRAVGPESTFFMVLTKEIDGAA